MTERRNDPQHFPAINGEGHRRRKSINMPPGQRFGLDRYERRTRDLVTAVFDEFDRILAADARRRGLLRGDPGE